MGTGQCLPHISMITTFAATKARWNPPPAPKCGFKLYHNTTIQHPGPLHIYMSKAPGNVTSYDGSGDWFRVHQEGICGDTSEGLKYDNWCCWNKNSTSFTLPRDTPPGQYLVRVEQLGLQRAFDGKAKFYFTCAQIEVTGSGSGSPGPVVKIPSVYHVDDRNIRFNIYHSNDISYVHPGPSV